ncbi:MAG: hypothetical protein NVSMB10_14820 [Steroidobacteraceae bacterium]
MSAIPADLTVTARWLLPMTCATEMLENQTLVIRDGRIIDILPHADATARYAAAVHVERRQHLLLPGLIDAAAQVTSAQVLDRPERARAETLLGIAELLRGGTTCFCTCGDHPEEAARAVADQGLRAVIGIPLADAASTWARTPGEYLTRALDFRDQYRGHPRISTAFAPRSPCAISDATFARIATLADELDAGIVMPLHESPAEIVECFRSHGMRPLERVQALGLVSPALTAVHMSAVDEADIAIAKRGGIAVTLCPEADLLHGRRPRPLTAWTAAGLRLSVAMQHAAVRRASNRSIFGRPRRWSIASAASIASIMRWPGHWRLNNWPVLRCRRGRKRCGC